LKEIQDSTKFIKFELHDIQNIREAYEGNVKRLNDELAACKQELAKFATINVTSSDKSQHVIRQMITELIRHGKIEQELRASSILHNKIISKLVRGAGIEANELDELTNETDSPESRRDSPQAQIDHDGSVRVEPLANVPEIRHDSHTTRIVTRSVSGRLARPVQIPKLLVPVHVPKLLVPI
jgi:hypothetical protein